MKEIAVLVSGGVDSSVALSLLYRQGFSVRAYYLKIWLADELSYLGSCPWEEDLAYAQAMCDSISVPLEVISLQKAYWETVVSYTLDQIKKGYTPNPDMMCNREVKLGAFLKQTDSLHDYVATGHYARRIEREGKMLLGMTDDAVKDQTYFLAQVPYEHLSRALFPLGDLTKKEVRLYADSLALPSAKRPDSQGICFLGKIRFKEFVQHYLGIKMGDIVEFETGRILGKHEGYWFFTIGQRQGIGLSGGPWYVVSKCVENNVIYVSNAYYDPDKSRNHITIADGNWLLEPPSVGENCYIKLRHGPGICNGLVTAIRDNFYDIDLSGRDQGIAPGQFAVLYTSEYICKGSGVLC